MEGIVLKNTPFEEESRILSIFTSDMGVISLMVKNLSKKNFTLQSITSVLSLSEFHLNRGRGDLFRFSDATLLDGYAELRSDLAKLTAAGLMLKLIRETQLPEKPAPALFLLLKLYLRRMKTSPKPTNLLLSFYLKALKHEGLLPCEKGAIPLPLEEDDWQTIQVLSRGRTFDVLESIAITPDLEHKVASLLPH